MSKQRYTNFDPNGVRLKEVILSKEHKNKIFVDIDDGNWPYVITSKYFSKTGVLINIEYIARASHSISNDCSHRLEIHLNDPEYDRSKVNDGFPARCIVDDERLQELRLRQVGS